MAVSDKRGTREFSKTIKRRERKGIKKCFGNVEERGGGLHFLNCQEAKTDVTSLSTILLGFHSQREERGKESQEEKRTVGGGGYCEQMQG